ncbi:putative UDP-N-acetylmuramoylalanine--D-glutamate ligase [Pillotina sp. SPG140]
MGLGLNGGGVEVARFLAKRGAIINITDIRDEKALAPSIQALEQAGIHARYTLGKHLMRDFEQADIVIKNPGVPSHSPFLRSARSIETDISLFLAENQSRLLAVTGSKGKSTTAAALHACLSAARTDLSLPGKAYLGGNSVVSPLSFVDSLEKDDDVVLELSSWQLGDLRDKKILKKIKPQVALFTAILPDHLDRYATMDSYVDDKRILFQNQDMHDYTVADDSAWGDSFRRESRGRPLCYADRRGETTDAWLTETGGYAQVQGNPVAIVPQQLKIPGKHQQKNLLGAGLALLAIGIDAQCIYRSFNEFSGIEHRLEYFGTYRGLRFYNDSAATIPEAAAAAVQAFHEPVILVCGGADKQLNFAPLVHAATGLKALILLAGSGTDRLIPQLNTINTPYYGPFDSIENVVHTVFNIAQKGDVVLLSPGCASFGMFLNEFDRGRTWKEAVQTMNPK